METVLNGNRVKWKPYYMETVLMDKRCISLYSTFSSKEEKLLGY